MKKDRLLRKGLVVAIILLFVGASVIPSIGGNIDTGELDVEALGVTDITSTSAKLDAIALGTIPVKACFYYGLTDNINEATETEYQQAHPEETFSQVITDLSPGTTYHWWVLGIQWNVEPPLSRAWTDLDYGGTFTTLGGDPVEKKALLIACWDYFGTKNDLKGPLNDVNNIKKLLTKGFDFDENKVKILRNPTQMQIINEINALKEETNEQDIKFLYYSGHGSRGSVEYIDPIDLLISDHQLKNLLSDEENLIAIFDSCYSGGLCHETDDTEDPGYLIKGINGDSKVIGMAARSAEESIETWLFPQGYFTKSILKSFHNRNKVRTIFTGDDSRISIEEALTYAKYLVEKKTWIMRIDDFPYFERYKFHPQIYDAWPTKENNNAQFYLADNPINNYWSFFSLCPVHIHAYDINDNHVGLNEYGDVQDEIPYVLYSGPWNDGELLLAFNNDTYDYIHIIIEAYDDGYFTLECQDYDKESQTTMTILYDNIFIVNGSMASVIVEDGVFGVMEIDDDGDGIIDRTISPNILPTTSFVPKSIFIYSPEKPFVDQIISFNASYSYDLDGDIFNYFWDFDDSTNGYGETIDHSYSLPREYKVTLTVTDDDGLTDIVQKTIEILSPVTMDIDPDILNLNSSGKWITCYIELTDGYDVANINISTISLNAAVFADDHPTNISDYDNDSIPDLMVKFDRQAVQDILEPGEIVAIMVTGKLFDETRFEGIDYIQVI